MDNIVAFAQRVFLPESRAEYTFKYHFHNCVFFYDGSLPSENSAGESATPL